MEFGFKPTVKVTQNAELLTGGATGMAAIAIPVLGTLWPLMPLAIAPFCTMLFSVGDNGNKN